MWLSFLPSLSGLQEYSALGRRRTLLALHTTLLKQLAQLARLLVLRVLLQQVLDWRLTLATEAMKQSLDRRRECASDKP